MTQLIREQLGEVRDNVFYNYLMLHAWHLLVSHSYTAPDHHVFFSNLMLSPVSHHEITVFDPQSSLTIKRVAQITSISHFIVPSRHILTYIQRNHQRISEDAVLESKIDLSQEKLSLGFLHNFLNPKPL